MPKFETLLPADFDGVFRFTNPSTEDFVGTWDGFDYIYPAQKTTAMLIKNATPLEVQNIRKKFARELAEREFFKSKKYEQLLKQERNPDGTPRLNSIHQSGQYSENELIPYIQKCLTSLPTANPIVQKSEKPAIEDRLSRDDDGELITRAVKNKGDLKQKVFSGDSQ